MNKLTNKVFIGGTIECFTGLRIGGNKSSLEIGGVDLNIIKSAKGEPYIPGSSLKGKLRSLLAKLDGSEQADTDSDQIKALFGAPGGNDPVGGKSATKDTKRAITRLFVRDAKLDVTKFEGDFPDKTKRDFTYSEIKTENVIERSTGKAQHPRSIERVPAGAVFNFEMVLDVYEGDNIHSLLSSLQKAMELLEYDYLGGHGSRGSGKVSILITSVTGKAFSSSVISDMPPESLAGFISDQKGQLKEKKQA